MHIHCIISGAGLTSDQKIRKSKDRFFIPVKVLRDKFKGKYLAYLDACHKNGKLSFPSSCKDLHNPDYWKQWKGRLYKKDWCPYIKKTFNGFGNAIEYLGRYTHKIAISNSRIMSVTQTETTFSARGKKPGDSKREVTLCNTEFIRRFLMHVLPSGFQKIRYYGFLNNRMKAKNLRVIFTLQGYQKFKRCYTDLSIAELLKTVWDFDFCICSACGHATMEQLRRRYVPSS